MREGKLTKAEVMRAYSYERTFIYLLAGFNPVKGYNQSFSIIECFACTYVRYLLTEHNASTVQLAIFPINRSMINVL